MKQFNLKEYLKNPSLKVVTRDGKEVRIVCTDAKQDYPIIALVKINEETETTIYLKENGRWNEGVEDEWDLFFSPTKKRKFDPHTLQPFDKVLVRDNLVNFWKCDHFSYVDDTHTGTYKYCTSLYYKFCIPYNDDTKHLVGTSDEAPEYYRYWEE